MRCINCEFFNIPGSARCARCASPLDLSGIAVEPPRRADAVLPTAMLLRARAEIRFSATHQLFRSLAEQGAIDNFNWPAVLRTVIPGWGLRFVGFKVVGWVFTIAWLFTLSLAVVFMGDGLGVFLAALTLGIHATSLMVLLAPSLQGRSITHRIGVGLLGYSMLLFGIYLPLRWTIHGFVVPVSISQRPAQAATVVAAHDVLLVRGRWLSKPIERGDIAAFRMPSYAGYGILVRSGVFIDRVIGLEGDLVEYDGKSLTVNGRWLELSQQPLAPMPAVKPFAIPVAPGEMFVVASTLGIMQHGAIGGEMLTAMVLRRARADDVVGTVLYRWRPFSSMGPLRDFPERPEAP
ncbi:MAG: S26 family signal peptidase [Phycisphaerales bacterium]